MEQSTRRSTATHTDDDGYVAVSLKSLCVGTAAAAAAAAASLAHTAGHRGC